MGAWSIRRPVGLPGVWDGLSGWGGSGGEGGSRRPFHKPVGSHRGPPGLGGVISEGSRSGLARAILGDMGSVSQLPLSSKSLSFSGETRNADLYVKSPNFKMLIASSELKRTPWRPNETLSQAGRALRQSSGTLL